MAANRKPDIILVSLNLFTLVSFAFLTSLSQTLSTPQAGLSNGKSLFDQKCSACHTIGGGRRVGPDLKGITETRSQEWLTGFISDPEKMFSSGDPAATQLLQEFGGIRMPNLGLSSQQISDVLAYIKSQSGAPSAPSAPQTAQAATPQAPPTPGSSTEGGQLFTGNVSFTNGGAPCKECHMIRGIPFPNGGTLGPDLTGAYSKYGETGLSSVLATLPFPTMTPVFRNHSLTAKEQSDLEAFFKASATAPPARSLTRVSAAILAGGVFIVLLILASVTWRNRLTAVRKALVRKEAGTRRIFP